MKDYSAEEVKEKLLGYASTKSADVLTMGQKGVMINLMNKWFGNDGLRHASLEWIFGVRSTKKLDNGQWFALWQWIKPFKDEETAKWIGRPETEGEMFRVAAIATTSGKKRPIILGSAGEPTHDITLSDPTDDANFMDAWDKGGKPETVRSEDVIMKELGY